VKFSVGFGLGPFRVSQRIGLPRGRTNSRPGYGAQFQTCTIKHRTIETEDRCGRKHPGGIRERRAQARSQERAARQEALARQDAKRRALQDAAIQRNDAARRLRPTRKEAKATRLATLAAQMAETHPEGDAARWAAAKAAKAAEKAAIDRRNREGARALRSPRQP
jgi:hypothetical protein